MPIVFGSRAPRQERLASCSCGLCFYSWWPSSRSACWSLPCVEAAETRNRDIVVGYQLVVASSAVRHSTGPMVRSIVGSAWLSIGRSPRTSEGESCRNSGECVALT